MARQKTPPKGPLKGRSDSPGFSMVEAAAALAVLSIIAAAAAVLFSAGARALENSRQISVDAARLLEAEATLREAAGEVRIPFWERRASLELGEKSASVPYYRGDAASRLELSWREGFLVVSRPGLRSRFPRVSVLGVGPLLGPAGGLRGFLVELSARGRRCEVAAPFGQCALCPGEE